VATHQKHPLDQAHILVLVMLLLLPPLNSTKL
jgi:hypothetical protein